MSTDISNTILDSTSKEYLEKTRLSTAEYIAQNVPEKYEMEGKEKIAVIFSNVQFKNPHRFREGGKKDAKDIQTALETLNFKVTLHKDPSFNKIHKVLLTLSEQDHKNTGCLVVVAMTHGHADKLEAFDDPFLTNTLWKFFEGDCPTLNGKPKLIFIQACRGTKHDAGVLVHRCNIDKRIGTLSADIREQQENITAQDVKPMKESSSKMVSIDKTGKLLEKQPSNQPPTIEDTKIPKIGSQTAVQTRGIAISQTDSIPIMPNEVNENGNVFVSFKVAIPTTPDMLVMYSSIDGYSSSRDPNNGSCFIQSLSAELKANGDKMELLQMLTNVTRMVAYRFDYGHMPDNTREILLAKQMTCFESTLTKQLYFAP